MRRLLRSLRYKHNMADDTTITANCIISTEESITVCFHGGIKPKQLTTNVLDDLTCEKVLQNCIEYIQDKVCGPEGKGQINGPKYLPTFGLVICPEERIWLPLNHVFKKSTERPRRYKFRVRFRPPADQFTESVMCEYLILQILDDFLKGPLGKNKNLESKTLFGLLQVALLFPTTLPLNSTEVVNENFKSRNFELWNFTKCFSREIAKRFISQPIIDHYWVYKTLKREIHGFKKHDNPAPLGFYKKEFYRLLMEAIPNYCFEEYQITVSGIEIQIPTSRTEIQNPVSGAKKATANIGLYKESGKQGALYFGETYQCSLKDILAMKLVKPMDLNDKKWVVEIDLLSEQPKFLLFEEEGAAESFITMVQGYYNLCIRYDLCLCKELQTASARVNNELKSFGPLGQHTAESFLEDSRSITESNSGVYLICESLSQFGQFEVVKSRVNQSGNNDATIPLRTGVIKCLEGTQLRLKMDGEETTFGNCLEVRRHLRQKCGLQLNPAVFQRMVDINEEFQIGIEYYGSHTSTTDVQNTSFSLPIIKSDLTNITLIPDKNPLVKKYAVSFNTEQMMLVELQSDKGEYAKSFREGLEKLHRLWRIKESSFLKFYGLVLAGQFSLLMEYVPFSDTLTYICEHPQSVTQKVNIMDQIVKILNITDTAKVYHGNLRLRKFMTFPSQEPGFVTIKLGDPGISSFMDTLPLTDLDNVERFPWLSPERRNNLKKITSESEVYAVGTTLCELLYRNDQFHEELRLGKEQTIDKYLIAHKTIPRPSFLDDNDEGAVTEENEGKTLLFEAKNVLEMVWSIILKCWAEDETERPTPLALLNDMREVRDKARNIDADTVFDKLKKVAYDVGMKDEDLKKGPGKRQLTIRELHGKFDNYYQKKFLLHTCIDMMEYKHELGCGHFGVVWKGRIRAPQQYLASQRELNKGRKQLEGDSFEWTFVAVKRMKNISNSDLSNLYKEVNLACDLDHRNIVKVLYLSMAIKDPPVKNEHRYHPMMLIMEFMNEGNLSNYARKLGDLDKQTNGVSQMLQIILDVAKGMRYLSGKTIVHRDLASRNILLSKDEQGHVIAKVSDFGLARFMEDNYRFYRLQPGEEVPIAWMPPECLEETPGNFTTEGDVWSFGTVMWEAFSRGNTPWKFLHKEIKSAELLNMYKKNWRLPGDEIKNQAVYSLMNSCWNMDQKKRPPFVELVQLLKRLIESSPK